MTKPIPSFTHQSRLLMSAHPRNLDAASSVLSAAQGSLDLLVIGGGIVGAGVARDAAFRGLRTGLVEQNDFASGTSSRSSRLLHGGIRYLAQGHLGLVREANKEKTIIHHIAPHLSEPLAFLFPSKAGSGWPRWQLRIGVKLYDFLCGRRKFGTSRAMGPRETLEMLPGHNPKDLTGSVLYYDGLTNDARLVLDTLRSAAHHGAMLANYVRFIRARQSNDGWVCELHDTRTNTELTIEAKCIVNAAGPWADQIPGSQTSLRLTKGVHLVIDRQRLPVPVAVVMPEDERILFAIPWGERLILGTTDTDYDGPLESPTCDEQDTSYVLSAVNQAFPDAKLTSADVLSSWAGLRPLVANNRGQPSDISRRHEIAMNQLGWWDVTGGKLTTYRLMAEETVDRIARHLERTLPACSTAHTPLLAGLEQEPVCRILPPEISEELVAHFCRHEWACHLDDVMTRRTSWRYYHANHLQIARQVAGWMASELDWSGDQEASELRNYTRSEPEQV